MSNEASLSSPDRSRRHDTAYQGPVVVTTLEIGGRAIRVVRPGDPDRLLDDPAVLDWNRRDDYMPYWAYLWPGAYLLAEVVMREPWPDLGPGTGPSTSTHSRSVAGWAWRAWQH